MLVGHEHLSSNLYLRYTNVAREASEWIEKGYCYYIIFHYRTDQDIANILVETGILPRADKSFIAPLPQVHIHSFLHQYSNFLYKS